MKSKLPLVALLGLFLSTPVLADDLIFWDGRTIEGVRVTKESSATVEYRRGSVSQKVDANELRDIRYGRTSPDFTAGMAAKEKGDMLAAANHFLDAAEDDAFEDREFIAATALVEAADALVDSSNFEDALSIYDQLLRQHSNTRHLARGLLGKGQCQFFTRQFPQAADTFETLASEVESKDLGETWGLEADFFKLWVSEAQGARDVVGGYEALRNEAKDVSPGVANRCSLRIGRVKLANADVRGALPHFEEIIDSRLESSPDVVAGAFNGRGRCRFSEAQGSLRASQEAAGNRDEAGASAAREDALDAFKSARLDFLRVQTVYKGVAREQAEALYFGGQAFLSVASLDEEAGQDELYGKILLVRCRDGFPGTEWGKKAASEL